MKSFAWMLLLLTGCTPVSDDDDDGDATSAPPGVLAGDETTFALQMAEAVCSLYEQCGYLAAYGDTIEACEAAMTELWEAYVTDASCDYDPALAQECLYEVQALAEAGDCDGSSEGSACDQICGP